MPEYNEDEVEFHAGERVEVLEKDDLYQDGWWQGRNLAGKSGLFPVSYTTPAQPSAPQVDQAPSSSSTVTPDDDPAPTNTPPIVSPVPKQPPSATFLNGDGYESDFGNNDSSSLHLDSMPDGEVMKATMTDVQKAIEQLGRGAGAGEDGDGSRSFSFASSRDGADTETDDTDLDISDVDGDFDGSNGEQWHKNARRKLADKARKAVEEAEKLEALLAGDSSNGRRAVAPPIEVEMSDESEDEGDFTRSSKFQRIHPNIMEEDENEEETDTEAIPEPSEHTKESSATETETQGSISESSHVFAPPRDESDLPTATATKLSFPVFSPPLPQPAVDPTPEESHIVSSSSAPALTMPAPPASLQQSTSSSPRDLKKTHPTEWTWLKSRGFDQEVCDKFTEQEITGDVLLELDVNLLKTEIGIMAFGKRMRIANAITELRRPPSIEYSDHQTSSEHPSPIHLQYSNAHSRSQSQSQSHHSFPGSIRPDQTHGYSQSIHSSLGSPMAFNGNGFAASQFEAVQESPSPDRSQNRSQNQNRTMCGPGMVVTAVGVGLGIGLTAAQPHSHPSSPGWTQLSFSPSDGALKETAAKRLSLSHAPVDQEEEQDRGHMSEGEIVPTMSIRRKLFGRSQDSALSALQSVRQQSPIPSPTARETPDKEFKDKESSKENEDKESKEKDKPKHSDRLSIFGNTFAGTLKGRKPVPRLSSAADDSTVGERTSKFSLPRLHGSSIRKSSSQSQRPTTPGKSQSPSSKDFFTVPSIRTVSAPHLAGTNGHKSEKEKEKSNATAKEETVDGVSGPIKQGQSILEQIGEPDHTGWMRKKGDRYNTWKLRYFVLKGPHMYCLRSNNKNETKIKGYIHIIGYKVTVDENIDPGRYGFRIDHDHDKTYFFSSEEKTVVRDWMKAIMKATIGRDYSKPVISSCNIPTIPLVVAQAMNPAPRPPSPSARDATQKALRRDHPEVLSSRDARVLMGLPGAGSGELKDDRERARVDTFFSDDLASDAGSQQVPSPRRTTAPPRPSREMRRSTSQRTTSNNVVDDALIDWANSHLPEQLQITDPNGSLCGGLALLRLAESIKGRPSSPPVPDSAFPVDANDDKLDGLFRLFDFLLDNEVKMGSVSINDVRQGKRDKIIQLLKALKHDYEGSMQAGAGFMVPVVM
ncbi:hypothetical protein CPB84DRAFT_1811707 [Gymnopilus junonius]|uniref:Uncharacterized protein n=1 Tax=Gymnopilus junonius TaxID=109634 RepID=A0A9P5P0D8_GYMJU|nr:hypothetical protein CPB84DRAFT_1811707 [Gymnopilus junonius]